jgi:hypothetical protein
MTTEALAALSDADEVTESEVLAHVRQYLERRVGQGSATGAYGHFFLAVKRS